MKIKSFNQLFENESVAKSKSFSNAQFDEFCDEVSKWIKEHQQNVIWCLYGDPKATQTGYNTAYGKDSAKKYWDSYVKGNKTFTLVEMGDSLVGVLHTDGNIELAFDNADKPVDKSKLKDLI